MIANNRYLLVINGVVLLGCAVFVSAWRDTLLIALMLLLPFIDTQWSVPKFASYKYQSLQWLLVIGAASVILISNPDYLHVLLYTMLLVALPEEWFFRAYFLQRLESVSANKWAANIATSAVFSLMHAPTQGWFSLAIFVPSIFIGWVYQKRRDIVLVILIHALLNIVYFVYLKDDLEAGMNELF